MAFTKQQKTTITVAVVCVAVVAAMMFLRPSGNTAAVEAADAEATVYSVRSVLAEKDTLISYIQSSGDVEATSSIEVYPDMGGKLVRMHVNLGSQVKKGQVIAEVDPSTPGVPYELSPVLAPLSGAITSQPLQPGTTVATSTAVAVIGSIDDLQITVHIPERHASLLHTGMKADVTVEAYPGVNFPATVVRISPVVDSVSRTKELQLTFDTKDDRVNAGMFAKVRLYTTQKDDVIVVPETAIMTALGKQYVFVMNSEGNKAVQRNITTGMSVDGLVEVVSGINEGDRIIIEGMHLLYDGSSVRDISSVSKTVESGSSEMAEASGENIGGDAV